MDLTGAEPHERLDPTGRRRDVRLAAGCLAGGLLLLGVLPDHDPRAAGPLVVICGALLLRRTAPVPAVALGLGALAVDLLLGPSLGSLLVFGQLMYDTALYARRPVTTWLLRGSVAVTVASVLALLVRGDNRDATTVGVTLALVAVLPVATSFPVRQHRDRARTERDRAEQVARLADLERRRAVAAERARMARELHDVIANHLSAVAIHASAGLTLRDLDADRLRGLLGVIRDSGVRGLAEMRQLIEVLRDPGEDTAAEPVGRPRLSDAATLVAGAAGVTARLEVCGEPADLPVAVDLAAYRIVQESLTNAGKHAAGGAAVVRLVYRPDRVLVTVESTGVRAGGPAVPGSGMGLVGMRERAVLLGGAFTAGPTGDGWRVTAELPTGGERP